MKINFTIKHIIFIIIHLNIGFVYTQCIHNPTVSSPRMNAISNNSVVLCSPSDSEVLTTQTSENYQWYKRQWSLNNQYPWTIINGATIQSITINGVDDFLYYFKVASTINGCTEESPEILIDGYAYQLPSMLSTFEPNTFEQIDDLEYNVCEGSSVVFNNINNDLWGNVTWYKCEPSVLPPNSNDNCIIANQTSDLYTATQSGNYGYYACTAYCPDQCEFLGTFGFIKLNFGNYGFCSLSNDDIQNSNKLSIYPNPVQQYLFIGKEADGTYPEINIFDSQGKLVFQKQNHKYTEPIEMSNLSSGSYIIISKSNLNRIYKNKIIKQ